MDRRIEVVLSKLENETSRTWGIDDLAAAVNLSASRLRHLFKMETGKTPARYLKDVRLQQAEILLRTTFFSVKEVAGQVGLTTGNLFREFKRAYGESPSGYRNLATGAVSKGREDQK